MKCGQVEARVEQVVSSFDTTASVPELRFGLRTMGRGKDAEAVDDGLKGYRAGGADLRGSVGSRMDMDRTKCREARALRHIAARLPKDTSQILTPAISADVVM